MAGGNRSSKKRAKLLDVIPQSPDIIGSLPEPILCHILSFLPTRESVATSILARRWRFLWTQVMSISLDGEEYDCVDFEVIRDIVDWVLQRNTLPCINTFSLCVTSYYESCNGHHFDSWISTALARNVKVFDLWLDPGFKLPHCLFVSKSLVEFTLQGPSCLSLGDVCLPNLKILNLIYVSFENGESLQKLISGCLVLEEFRIHSYPDRYNINISSPTLKRIALYCPEGSYFEERFKIPINLDTPALHYLYLQDTFYYWFSSQNLPSLVKADIYLNHSYLKEDIPVPYLCSLFEFVESLSLVKFLKLSSRLEMKPIMTTISGSIIKFHNLIKLHFEADWRLLTKFLEIADNLEVLIIKKVNDNLSCWIKPEKVPKCLLSRLRKVIIQEFGYTEPDFKMVKYILRNARFLKRMEIHFNRYERDYATKSKARRKISHFRRGYEACEVAFIC